MRQVDAVQAFELYTFYIILRLSAVPNCSLSGCKEDDDVA